ncbi:MAG: penicillin acylase family protein [Gemmatimonadales bacterium]|nr:penicillin acylase family protein [Gemmatimonadales bacterium]
MFHRLRRILLIIIASLLGLALLVFLAGTFAMRGSRPRLEGTVQLADLDQPVVVTRDALGVPDIQAQSRPDAAHALGYIHAQDRFFQMDLQRRNAAGELAALLGPALVETDRDTRRHRFRARAEIVVAGVIGEDRKILDAYAAGVNAGLDDLQTRPFEYLALRQKPDPWRPADTVLTLYAMFLDLTLSTVNDEKTWATARDNLPPALAEFLLPRGNRWEAPLQDYELSEPVSGVVLPDSSAVDVRTWQYGDQTYGEYHDRLRAESRQPPRQDTSGSNNWAVAGSMTGHGGALLANDMHLSHSLPNIWYRARMSWPENESTGEGKRSVVGVTLPGTPAMVAGSNGQVAWGFTNSQGDWVDLVILETDPKDPGRYRTPDGWRPINRAAEIITVAGAEPDTLWIEETIWGPVWTTDSKGRRLALRWTAHDTEAVNLNLMRMETVDSIDAVVALAGTVGIPQQNLVCADDQGHIAWTIVGPIPRRVGWDGRLPVSWADGTCRWDGYHDPAVQPRVIDPAEGLLWTANSRVTAGADLQMIGDGGYGLGPRARQVRDGLRALVRPVEKDMLALQLDDRAVFLEQWRDLALETLEQAQPEGDSPRADFLRVVGNQWSGRAEVESVAYRLVRSFVYECIDLVYKILVKDVFATDPEFRPAWLPYRHAVTWEVLEGRPDNLLPPMFDDWDDLVLEAVDGAMKFATDNERDLADYTWGARNVVVVAHPFTRFAPWLSRWLAAPPQALPGDSFMPRVQHRRYGASQRLVVSPGREEQGILHMPGGQSGHPLSPFFLVGHQDWAEGKATSLLPGSVQYQLELVPRK